MTQAIPVADSLPLIGSAWPMYDALPQFLHDQYRKHGPVFMVRAVGREFLILAGVDAVNFVGSPEGKNALGSKDAFQGMISEYGTDEALVNSDGDRHAQFRKMVHKGYSREALTGRYEKVIDVIDDWLNSNWTRGASIPIVTKLQELVVDELSVVFGDMLLFDDIEHIRTQIHWSTNVHLLKRWPKIALRLPKYQRAKARLIADATRITAIFEERAKAAPNGIAGTRLFDDLIAANKQYPDIMTRHDLPMNLFGPFLGGMDTASNTIAAILGVLARHPEHLANVESEADSLFSAGTPDEDTLFAITPFLQAVVKESMRLYPSVPVLMRHARRDFCIAGHDIRQGQQIMVATCVSHLSEDYFADPTTFDPYRFIGPDRMDVPAGALAPFGRGHHLCMGKRIAEVLIPLTVARVVHQREYELVDKSYQLKNRFSYGVELAADLQLLAGSSRRA
ncbi:cytochrome P450 [Mycolicibacterium sp. P9-64]|uniref:cytochrome P450 n=1 Tax=Mycolicibacterium sp. P9-64 TaxID=2024612 RepID=UPI0011EBB052|nr:cytochrome P450 [Mycolicibacterium sp. P9-64]KAA0082356.1 cytochrome P450 [Mycolicibacterium sp. P9-64]